MAAMEGRVGQQTNKDGSNLIITRVGNGGEVIMSPLRAKYFEDTHRENGFIIDSDSVTLAAANATKSAAGTIKLIVGVWNPKGSGVNLEIIKGIVHTESGTPAGGFYWNYMDLGGVTLTNVPTGTIRNRKIGGRNSVVSPQTGVVLTRADSGTGAFTQLAVLGGPTAVAATGAVEDAVDEVDGKIIVPPGVVIGICCKGAGTSHVVQASMYFNEVPI